LGVLDHRIVRLQRNVDGSYWIFLRARSLCEAEQRCQADAEYGKDLQVTNHATLLLCVGSGDSVQAA
jgi:hypothetical protein